MAMCTASASRMCIQVIHAVLIGFSFEASFHSIQYILCVTFCSKSFSSLFLLLLVSSQNSTFWQVFAWFSFFCCFYRVGRKWKISSVFFIFIFPSHCHVCCILSDSMLLMATVYRQWRRWNGNVCRFRIYMFDVIFDLLSTPNNCEQTKTAKIILRRFQIRYFIHIKNKVNSIFFHWILYTRVECDALVWYRADSIKVQLHLFSINVCWFDDRMLSKQLSKFQFFRFLFSWIQLKIYRHICIDWRWTWEF